MPLNIVRDDLSNMKADAIVLPANEQLEIDGGAGGAVARKAGRWRLQHACRKIGGCATGGAVATSAFAFPAKHFIHAVGPVWQGRTDDLKLLRSAYRNALNLAAELHCSSVALPLLSSGVRKCPAAVTLSVALDIIEEFLEQHDNVHVTLVLFDRDSVAAGLDFLGDLERHIDDATASYIRETTDSYFAAAPSPNFRADAASSAPRQAPAPRDGWQPRYFDAYEEASLSEAEAEGYIEADARYGGFGYDASAAPESTARNAAPPSGASSPLPHETGSFAPSSEPKRDSAQFAPFASAPAAAPAGAMPAAAAPPMAASLENRLDNLDTGFSQKLLQLIDESGLTDAQVYRRANMSRQHFSKIRSNVGYRPSKATVLSLCIALHLDLTRTRDLLERAGFALTHASKFDIIIEYFIERGIYDPFKINETLFYFDQPLLGG